MSPGGLCSLAFGLTAEVEPPDPPPHPASTASTVAGPAKSTREIRMAATVGPPRHPPVPARSTGGKTSVPVCSDAARPLPSWHEPARRAPRRGRRGHRLGPRARLAEPGVHGSATGARRHRHRRGDARRRPRHPRPRPARRRRHRRVPGASGRPAGAGDPDPHGARSGARRGLGPRRRRRRLPRQALPPLRATRARARPPPPQHAARRGPAAAACGRADRRRRGAPRLARRTSARATPEGIRPSGLARVRGGVRRHARADHGRGLGSQLARVDEDPRHAHPLAAAEDRARDDRHPTRGGLPPGDAMRRSLVLAIGAVAAGSVVLFAIPPAIVLERQLHDEALLRLQRDAIAATRAIDLPAQHGDPVEVPRSHDLLAVYGRSGRRIAGAGRAAPGRQFADALRTGRPSSAEAGERLVVAVPVLSRERGIGALRASRSTAALDADVRDAWLIVTGLGLGVIAIAVLAALAVSRRLTRPVERLAGAAARLGEGDFSARAPRTGVPELDAVAATLDATAERLDQLLRRERAFTADASHQLRTPLAALRLELEAMELDAPSEEVERALEQIDRLEATIATLLAVARDTPRDRAEIDLVAAVDAVEPTWHSRLAADGRPLRIQPTGTRPRARAAPAVVDQVLDVLLDNAYRHGHGEVTVTVRETPRGAAIDVSDQGPGLDGNPEAPSARGPSGGNGHGIGLALARSLAEAEGGALVVSNPGPHPVFTLLIGAEGRRRSHPPLIEPVEHH